MAIEPYLVTLSRELRKNQTPWEKRLWMYLKSKRFAGLKWKRQVVIHQYIVDFCCFEKKLIIELDGSQHTAEEAKTKDLSRDIFLQKPGYVVLRFYNNDIDLNMEGVIEVIYCAIDGSTSPPTPLLARRGG